MISVPAWAFAAAAAQADCTPAVPASGQSVTCTGANQPAFIAPAGVTGLSVTNTSGSSITGVAVTVAGANAQRSSVRINDDSTFTNATGATVSPTLLANSQRDYVGVNLNGTNATLVNNGDITVTNDASLAGSATYRLYGVITSNDADAPEFENVSVLNRGTITISQSGAGIARGTYAGEDIGSMRVENFGTISVTRIGNDASTAAVGATDADDDVEELTVINHEGATLSSSGANTYTVQGRAGEYEVLNDGTIDHSGTGAAILIWRGTNTGTAMAEVENGASGIINGDVYLVDRNPNTGNVAANGFARDSEIENAGRINGSVFLGRGTHVVENEGTITGAITVDQVGSGAADAFTRPDIQGATTFSLINTGTIGGSLTINDAATSVNTLTLVTGSSIGDITAANGVGSNALILAAPGGDDDDDDDDDDDAPAGGTTQGTLTGNVTGFTTLTQTGGVWTLAAGTTQSFSQGATVDGGTLIVNSTLNADTEVEEEGTLAGIGTINGSLTNEGVVAPGSPGDPYGVLTVNGVYTQESAARFVVAGRADGTSSKLQINGAASLAGDVFFQAAPGIYAPGTRYTVLSASGGLTGQFDSASSSGLPTLLAPTAANEGNDVVLTLEQQSFLLVAQTPNQRSVSPALDTLLAGNIPALTFIDNNSDETIRGLLDQVAGQGYASIADPQLRSGRMFADMLVQRGYTGLFESGPTGFTLPPATYAADVPNRRPVPEPRFIQATRGYGVWATGYGQTGNVSTTLNATGRDETLAGFAAGIDMNPGAGSILGIAAGYGSVDVSLRQTGERAHTDNAQVGIYGGLSSGALYATAALGYAHADGRLTRALPGLQPLQPGGARGAISGNQFLSAGEAGYRYAYAPNKAVVPFVGFQVATFDQDRVNENGGGLFDLNVASKDFLSARTLVGGRLEHFADFGGRTVSFAFKAAYVHDFADVNRTIQSNFVLAPAVPFRVSGRALDRDRALVGIGIGTLLAPGLTGFVNYDAEVATSDTIQGGRAGMRYSF